ncbi:uncharacterized protein LOC143165211 [Aptenodytes patagonicus]|uniref:uncharacterized protein LOC143165211 n=1 Tax=Aptenodytes patagonicus TaxID=9234 RepID=UPI003F9F78C1
MPLRRAQAEHSLNPNSSLWDMDYEGLLHSKKTLPGTVGSYKPSSLFRSRSLLSHQGRRSLLSQNLGQKPQEKRLSCDMLLKLSRYILMDTFGPSLAWNLFRFYNCDREVNLPKIRIGPLKVAQHKVKPFLLRRVLQLLRNMGVLSEAQQSKAFSLLKKQMLKPRKTSLKPKVEQSGRYIRRRGDFGISNAFWCWLSGVVRPGSEPALSIGAELEPGLRVLNPKQEVCDEAGRRQSLSAEEETLDEGLYGVRRAVAADGPL